MTTLLIVDDSPIARQILRKCLPKDADFTVLEACDGRDAIEKFQLFRPAITFMDMTMPVMDGFEAIAEIRRIDPKAVIIAATANIQPKARKRIADLGALMLLPKPVNPGAVRDALSRARIATRDDTQG